MRDIALICLLLVPLCAVIGCGGSIDLGEADKPGAEGVATSDASYSSHDKLPKLALDGYCPVTLCQQSRWQRGDSRWGANHRGQTYLFAGEKEQQEFLEQPLRYSPVAEGMDVVIAVDQKRKVAGNRRHGVFYQEYVFLFSSEKTLEQFWESPQRYAATYLVQTTEVENYPTTDSVVADRDPAERK